MPNTLTSLIPDVYAALDVVSRELTGFLPGIQRNATTDAVALNQTVRAHQTRRNTAGENITPAMSIPAAADQTVDNIPVTISKVKAFPFSWSGEEQYAMNSGPGFLSIRQDQVAQAIRAAVNEIEADLATAAYLGASRATGAVGTIPFSTTLGASAQLRKILDDNGAPASGRSLVISTTVGANLRTLAQLTKANEAGTNMTLRDGELLNLHGFSVRESAQIQSPAVGTSTNAVVANGGVALGATSITLKAVGTGTIVAGDVITIEGDTNQYVVTVGAAAVSGATIQIAAPGLRKAIVGEKDITIAASGARNVGFSQDALLLAARLPVLPAEGDMATGREIITDPRSGLSFYLAVYPGYHMNRYQIELAWGVKAVKPEHMAILLE
jgi:hypothetical protein